MNDGIKEKPTQSQREYTYQYLCDHPTHLYKMDLTVLRDQLEFITYAKEKESKRTLYFKGVILKVPGRKENLLSLDKDYKNFEYWEKKIRERIKTLERKNKEEIGSNEKQDSDQVIPKGFEELFYFPENAEPCLDILRQLEPPYIDANNKYIGKNKGIFSLWVRVLIGYKDGALIKTLSGRVYSLLLNNKIAGLDLTKEGSEFGKIYKRLENDKVDIDIRQKLSKFSLDGRLRK